MRDREEKRKYQRRYYRRNRKAILLKTNDYLSTHPEVKRRSQKNRIYREHDITEAQYDNLLKNQDGKCAICQGKDSRSLSVDHDHECCSGERSCRRCNRGLLCNQCNKKLSVIEDNPFVEKALKYLSKYRREASCPTN